MATDYYELLGLTKSATDAELRTAYRKLARQHHPDTNGGDPASEAHFKEITAAYETLRDPERRRRYDMFGPEGARGQSGPSVNDLFGSGLGDIFESFFSGGGPFGGGSPFGGGGQSAQRRGDDIEAVIELSFEQSIFGADMPVTVRAAAVCDDCDGSGASPGTSATRCRDCDGAGQVRRVRQSILGQVVTTSPCPTCQGLGTTIASPCATCRGEGRMLDTREVTVEVPAGVDNGTTLRVTGAGGAAHRGGVSGDLYVHLRVRDDERFRRSGANLEMTLHIPVTIAALGGDVDVATLDGTESIEIPAGTVTGKLIRIRGRGIPMSRGTGRGDLQVLIYVDTPQNLTKEQIALLRELAELRDEPVATDEPGIMSRIRSSFG